MTAKTSMLTAPPFEVEQALNQLGANLRTARLRRNLSLQEIADRIGVSRQAISAAEKGKPSSSIALYAAMLWALGLAGEFGKVLDPDRDEEGKALERLKSPERARHQESLDNDF